MSRADEPAMPCSLKEPRRITVEGPLTVVDCQYGGVTIREHFAAMALCGLCHESPGEAYTPEGASTRAVRMADALLAALQRPQRGEGE